ncbi:hypothetical protein ACHAWF_001433, partial [Thalassiosira exigua]
ARKPKVPSLIEETKKQSLSTTTAASAPSSTKAPSKDITEKEVRALFELWNSALATGDSRIVADRYIKRPMLLPSVSDQPRTDFDSVKDYFDAFLLKKPQGKILEGSIYIGDGWASDTGIYEFTMGATGDKVKARYSYNYVMEDGVWKIQHHHSSVMPEEIAMGKPITEEDVRGLFSLWNDALATLDPKKVAARYAKKGVLLPTVSDTPRSDFTSIEDYFVNFLKNKPQGEILESHVTIGHNTCSDVGIYEFTMGATGAKVKGRYSFVYVFEDGEWKIDHHHSSVMPEGTMAQPITEEEVRNLFQLWNSALATEDADAVAKRYAKDAVLLRECFISFAAPLGFSIPWFEDALMSSSIPATVSDVPRTNYSLIKHYFVDFLKKKPQGTILESNVSIGHNWCQDSGIYEFTMGATGDKVKGRYSFVYVYEDGQWKISHHHSSVMPEDFLGPAPKPDVAVSGSLPLV